MSDQPKITWRPANIYVQILPRCIHDYERIGYGGAGWLVYRCRHCGEQEIGHG